MRKQQSRTVADAWEAAARPASAAPESQTPETPTGGTPEPALEVPQEPAVEAPHKPAAQAQEAQSTQAPEEPATEVDSEPPSPDKAALEKMLEQKEQELAALKDRYLRALADNENLKRRFRQELEEARRFSNEQLLSSLVSVLDNLQRALEAAESSENFAALKEGVSLTQKQLLEVLARSGLEPIEAVGQPFDPALHEALGHVEAPDGQAPDTVVEEIQRGYTLHGRLLRPSLVRVAS